MQAFVFLVPQHQSSHGDLEAPSCSQIDSSDAGNVKKSSQMTAREEQLELLQQQAKNGIRMTVKDGQTAESTHDRRLAVVGDNIIIFSSSHR